MDMQRVRELKIGRQKPVRIWAGICCFLLFLCVLQIIRPCQEYQYEGSSVFVEENGTEYAALYSGIDLRPGVYRIELEYATDTDLAGVCNIEDGTVFFRGLLTNGEHLYSGLDKTGYDIWLFEGTKALQVTVDYGGKGSLVTGNLKIVETNQLWTMLMAVIIAAGAAGILLLTFYYYDRRFPVSAEKKHVFFFVTAISLVASVPYISGYNITGADLTYHLQRIEGVKDGLLGGQFPVRLEPRWVFDHGYANAIFYCNTFLYFPALLRLLGFTVLTSYNVYCMLLNLATAWISYYCFSRIFKDHNIGLICSALYTLSIFRIYKLVVTSATGEGTAVTFIPLVLYGLYRIYTEDPKSREYRHAWVPVTLGVCGLIQSHVLTCEITAGVIFLYCIFNIRRTFHKNTFMVLLKATVSSILLCLWFLVPFLDYYVTQDVHIKHVSGRTIQDRGLYFAHLAFHFWKTGDSSPGMGNGMQYSHPVGIGLVLVLGLGIFLILWFSGVFRDGSHEGMRFVKHTAVMGALLMFMSMDVFPWDRIQSLNSITAALVSSLQFPNRFLGWGTACLVLVFGFCLQYLKKKEQGHFWVAIALTVAGVATSGMYLLDYVNSTQDYFRIYNEEGMGFGYISGAEYLIEGTKLEKLTFTRPKTGKEAEILDYEKSYFRTKLRCANKGGNDSYVDLPILLYKGYRAVNTDTGEEMDLCAGENNVIRVIIPAGFEGSLEVDFVSPVYWRISELISVLTAVMLCAAFWHRRRFQKAGIH